MLHNKIKEKIDSTVNHVKAHPAIYGYAAGVVVATTFITLALSYGAKDLKLVSLTQSLKRIHDEGLGGLKWEMGEETLLLVPVDPSTLNLD